jgi:hypothetical protein
LQVRYLRNKFTTPSQKLRMTNKRKLSAAGKNDVKAGIIRKHGTIAAFIRAEGFNAATVYSAIKNRRNGPTSRAIRALALR